MSNLVIATAHLVAIPVRYAVGRWSNIPTNTLLVFNAVDLGLNILIKGIYEYITKSRKMNVPVYLNVGIMYGFRGVVCLTAMYAASRLTEPIPIKTAALTNLAAAVSVLVAITITKWIGGQK